MPEATARRHRRARLARRVGGLVVLSAAVAALAPATSSTTLVDFDNDGLGHIEERLKYGTDPWKADTDSDGLKDGEEVKTYKTSPTKANTDGDVLKDGEEVKTYKTDPKKRDTDGDVADDNVEIYDYGTNPLKPDTDGDGFSDGDEVYDAFNKSDPKDTSSVPYHDSQAGGQDRLGEQERHRRAVRVLVHRSQRDLQVHSHGVPPLPRQLRARHGPALHLAGGVRPEGLFPPGDELGSGPGDHVLPGHRHRCGR